MHDRVYPSGSSQAIRTIPLKVSYGQSSGPAWHTALRSAITRPLQRLYGDLDPFFVDRTDCDKRCISRTVDTRVTLARLLRSVRVYTTDHVIVVDLSQMAGGFSKTRASVLCRIWQAPVVATVYLANVTPAPTSTPSLIPRTL